MATLSLGDVARLSAVSRPVVSMWRKRPKDGREFPAATPDGRFPADAVVDYLEQTQRGNNPNARRDLAIAAVRSAHSDAALRDLMTLLVVKALTGETLAELDREDLLDAVDEVDPDDEWIFSEAESVDVGALAREADAVADAAWSTADAYEMLLRTVRSRDQASVQPGEELVSWLATLARLLPAEEGALVDAAGSATDVVVRLLSHDEGVDLPVVLPATGGVRDTRRRYAMHGLRPRATDIDDDWTLPDGSLLLVVLPPDADVALDLLEEVALQLGGSSTALVVGPASVLIDQLPGDLGARRDAFLRGSDRTLAAAVRLPQGLSRSAGREHLALWLMQPNASESIRIGDLAGLPVTPTLWQQLLDDLLAVASGVRLRAFAHLRPIPAATLLAASRSLVDHDVVVVSELAPSAADDAARIQHLLDALASPLPNPFTGQAPWVRGSWPARHVTLGEATRSRQVSVIAGTRIDALPEGTTRLWTRTSLNTAIPSGVDLLALSAAHPKVELTQPGDVVFATDGQPRGLVDTAGGAAVAYPVRVIRVRPEQPFSAHAIAAAINAVDAGNSKWRTWQIPVVSGDVAEVDGVLARVDELATLLDARQTQVEELRRLAVRTVLPGSVAFRETLSNEARGE